MSTSLVKKALEIIESDGDDDQQQSSNSTVKQPSFKKYGLKKEKKRLEKKALEEKERGKVICDIVTNKRSTLDEYRMRQNSNLNKKKLKELKKLRSIKVDRNVTRKIIEGLDSLRRRTPEECLQNVQDKPFFTEDDFQRYVKSIL